MKSLNIFISKMENVIFCTTFYEIYFCNQISIKSQQTQGSPHYVFAGVITVEFVDVQKMYMNLIKFLNYCGVVYGHQIHSGKST
jgi:hypothetical protein